MMMEKREVRQLTAEYNRERLDRVLEDFSVATGINVNFADCDQVFPRPRAHANNPFCKAVQATPEGHARCVSSDRTLLGKCEESRCRECHVCHAGLTDVAVPIYDTEQLLGYIILGQMKTDAAYTGSEELRPVYDALPLYTDAQIRAIASVAEMLARTVLLEGLLRPSYRRGVEEATAYIDAHLCEKLSASDIARNVYVSKTALYEAFHLQFGCTVGEYVNARRLTRSRELLQSTSRSVEAIAQEVGFSGTAYYSRLFKKKYGISPLRYRKSKNA